MQENMMILLKKNEMKIFQKFATFAFKNYLKNQQNRMIK